MDSILRIGAAFAGYYVYANAMERVHQLQAKLEAAFDAVLQKLFCQALNRLESNKSHTGGKAAAAANSSPDDADARIEASEFFLSLDGGDENYEGTLDMADINRMFDCDVEYLIVSPPLLRRVLSG